MDGIINVLESSALILRLLDDDKDVADGTVVGAREVVTPVSAREVGPLIELTDESKSVRIFFLWEGVIFDQ